MTSTMPALSELLVPRPCAPLGPHASEPVPLSSIRRPADLRGLTHAQLDALAAQIRSLLVEQVSRSGGHLGPNLGVVELTLALHRVFDSPRDAILWDTGHQAYVHKLVTGRQAGFARLRQAGGLSGYPSGTESEHDIVENSHASTALAWADGLAKGRQVRGGTGRVVAVVGDGALTGGMAWEALNNLAAAPGRPVVIVLNDNGRSYAPTVGGLASHLSELRARMPHRAFPGRPAGTSGGGNIFTCMGLHYLGPVDGHDLPALEIALRTARDMRGPVVVHCVTVKGKGYPAAERHQADRLHIVRAARPGAATHAGPDWTGVFGAEMITLGRERPDLVAVTAAMPHPVGLDQFAAAYPDRLFDVGIAEQHAVTSAAGLARAGLHPVVAIYATFLNRAFDQVLMDAALHRCGMTLVLDRAGVTGDDGPSHNGMWDLSWLQLIPGLRIAAPRDGAALRARLREAVDIADAPTVLRFPKGQPGPDIPAIGRTGGVDVLHRSPGSDPGVLIVSVGAMAATCLAVADGLAARGIGCTVVDPRWVKPVDPALASLAAGHSLVVTVEDNGRAGGVGAAVAQSLRDARIATPLTNFGLPQQFIAQGTRAQILADAGLDAPALIASITDLMTGGRP
jgi:1-deoxy-D-xylulose-5-phosphate synthase